MSRSYKKHFYCKDTNSKCGKRAARRVVRRTSDSLNGSKYKRLYCSWNICDYKHRGKTYTAKEFCKMWYDPYCSNEDFLWYRKKCRNWKEAYRKHMKWYIMK